jgi:hypothetical protein
LNPVVGDGFGGEKGTAVRPSQLCVGNEYRIYYKSKNGNIRMAVSRDGFNYQMAKDPVISAYALNHVGVISFDNVGFYWDGRTCWALVETNNEKPPKYRLWLFKSADRGRTFQPEAGPLTSMSPGGPNNIFCSPRALVKVGKTFHCWYHVNVPSSIFHAASPDLVNWTPDLAPTLSSSPNMFGLADCNQAADPCLAEADGKTILYYDGTDNANAKASIGLAVFNGTPEDYAACKKR